MPKRGSDRAVANVELPGEICLNEVRARVEVTLQDLGADPVGDDKIKGTSLRGKLRHNVHTNNLWNN
jgi:hypothetical protein